MKDRIKNIRKVKGIKPTSTFFGRAELTADILLWFVTRRDSLLRMRCSETASIDFRTVYIKSEHSGKCGKSETKIMLIKKYEINIKGTK